MINSDKSFALFQRDEYIRQKHNIVAVLLKNIVCLHTSLCGGSHFMARKLEELVYFKIDNCFYIIIVFIK